MRCGDHLFQFDQRMLRRRRFVDVNVQRRAGDFAGLYRLGEIVLIDDAAARAVDNAHAVFHLGEGGFVDQSLGVGRERNMHGNEIRLGKNLIERARLHAHARDILGGDERIETDDFHPQSGSAFGDDPADVAEADDADGFVAKLDADELIALPLAGFERRDGLGDMARQRHHQGNRMFSGSNVVAAGRVHDHDAPFGRRVGVDVLVADAGAADHLEILRRVDQLRSDPRAAADHPAVVVGADFLELVGFEAEFDIDGESVGVVKYRQAFGSE